jgi:hypothetical protein
MFACCAWSERAVAQPAAAPAAAAAAGSEAERIKAEGDRAMQRLEYQAALEAYERAYAIDQNPALLYNRGRTLQALGRFPDALEQIEAFERDAPSELKERVPRLRELINELKARVSTLALTCNVKGARVLVRRRQVGTTPLPPIRLNSGSATIEVVADGYHPFKHTTNLQGGGQASVHALLHSKNTTGILEVSSPVAGADVFVNGSRLGSAPAQTVLKAGEHRVLVRRPGYEQAETTAVISAGRTTRLEVPLDQPPPITARWWFWTGVGAVVVGGIVLTAALLTEREADRGDIPPGQVSGPLLSF